MNKWKIMPVILLAAITIISCNKNSSLTKDGAAAGLFPPPSLRVKEMTTYNSVTRFYYNREGGVDSTVEQFNEYSPISTVIYGKGIYIDSIHKFRDGYLTHRWNNVKYNNAGQITEFTRWYNEATNNYVKYLLSYDNNGNMIEHKVENREGIPMKNTFVYNQDKALTSHSFWLYDWEQEWTIKSDTMLNPLYKMPHFFITAESPNQQQEALNKYNSIERIYVPNQILVTWQNDYDQNDRLVRRSSSESPWDWYSLTYY